MLNCAGFEFSFFIKSFVVSLLLINYVVIAQRRSVSLNDDHSLLSRNFVYNVWKYDQLINVEVNATTEQILDFYEDDDKWAGFPSRVFVSTEPAPDLERPLFITATQQKGAVSWQLPPAPPRAPAGDLARTLCPLDAPPGAGWPTLRLSAAGAVRAVVRLRRELTFLLRLDQELATTAAPAAPRYHFFSWERRDNRTAPHSVLLTVRSDDELCALVAVQDRSCPVRDELPGAGGAGGGGGAGGARLTVSTRGGLTLTRAQFPAGFYVVLMVLDGDEACAGAPQPPRGDRLKNFTLVVTEAATSAELLLGVLVLLAVAGLVAALAALLPLPFNFILDASDDAAPLHCDAAPLDGPLAAPLAAPLDGPLAAPLDGPLAAPVGEALLEAGEASAGGSSGEGGAAGDGPCEWGAGPLTVAGLSRARRRSDRYFWNALTVAVVYALPVVQLLYTYQRMVFQTGDQDLCYYNALCAHPLGPLADANHVASNAGYVLLGLAFLLQTRCRRRPAQGLGIPQHEGLLYALGLALVMEGLLSAAYHLCPNKMNFQFDSSFMYVIAVVCMVKLYQNRHPDANASAHATFLAIALLMALGVVGILAPSEGFWAAFTALHLAACLALTVNIYYVGRVRLGRATWGAVRAAVRERGRDALRPRLPARAALLAVANVANWALAGYGLYEHNRDFARHLLAVLMGNAILYTLFYVAMKLAHRERLLPHTWLYLVLAHVAWFLALRFFLDSRTKWSEAPAQSRRHNAPCAALRVLDSHDLWHLASAAALYLSLNMLLTVDDALALTPRHLIPAF